MSLRDLKLGFALGTTQDLAFFDFVFIDIDFGGTFGAADHGSILRRVVREVAIPRVGAPPCSVLYTAGYEVNSHAWPGCFECHQVMFPRSFTMASSREYPEKPVVGIGGVIIEQGRTLLIRRGSEPLRGEWSIPGGTLEVGETLHEGVARELLEETGVEIRVLELIEVFDRIFLENEASDTPLRKTPRFHFVIVDYLCERVSGEPRAGSDVTDVAFAREDELPQFHLTGEMKLGEFILTRECDIGYIAPRAGFAANAFAEIVHNDEVESRCFPEWRVRSLIFQKNTIEYFD